MNINLRSISEELHQQLRIKAAQGGVSLQSLCVSYLQQGLQRPEPISVVSAPNPRAIPSTHDKASCRVYGCLRCKAME